MRRYDSPTADIRDAVRKLIDRTSPKKAARILDVAETTVARLAAGLPVTHETIEIVRGALTAKKAA